MEVSMARKSGRAALMLEPDQRKMLEGLAASRTSPVREVERAKVLLGYAAGTSITQLQRQLGLSRPMIYRCVDKALAAGVQAGLKDKYHRPHAPEITDEERNKKVRMWKKAVTYSFNWAKED
jgi:transposase